MPFKKKKILAIIPCRSGSKSIKNKNITKVYGKSLLEYSLIFAKQCSFFDKIIISTDSHLYKKIAEKFGIDVPFIRPKNISKDNSTDLEFIQHALKYLKCHQNFIPDLIVHLRPTSPLRKIRDIKRGLDVLVKNEKIDSVKTISLSKNTPFKSWFANNKNFLIPIIKNRTKFSEPYNAPRQFLPKIYDQTALFDIYRAKVVMKKKLLSGKKIYGLKTEKYLDIDTKYDINRIKRYKSEFKNFKKFILKN